MPPAVSAPHKRDRRFAVFSFLFASATLFYHAQLRVPFDFDFATAAFVAAVATILRPASLRPFSALVVLQTVAIYGDLPLVNTNRILQFFVGVIILITMLVVMIKQRSTRLTGGAVLTAMEMPVKVTLLIVYFWAFMDKLNWAYLDPSQSCAVEILTQLPLVERVPGFARLALIAMTLLIEGLTVPLLLVARWRAWGVRIALAFHLILGLAWFYSFSATMTALLSLFLSADDFDRAAAAVRVTLTRRRSILFGTVGAAFVAFGAMLLYADPGLERTRLITSLWQPTQTPLRNLNIIWNYVSERLFLGLWCAFAVPIAMAWMDGFRQKRRAAPEPLWHWRLTAWPALIVTVFVFLNGAWIYLGGKTEWGFAMYSNLRTEPGFENHLFLPSIPLAPYQSDLVVVTFSTDRALQQIADSKLPLPRIELQRQVNRRATGGVRNMQVVYVDADGEHRVDAAEVHPTLSRPLSYVEQKFLRFREIRTGVCSH